MFLLKRCQNRAHILEGLILAVSDIDEIIELIKKSPDAPTAKQNLMKKPLKLAETETLRKLLSKRIHKGKDEGKTVPDRPAGGRDFDNAIAAADGA